MCKIWNNIYNNIYECAAFTIGWLKTPRNIFAQQNIFLVPLEQNHVIRLKKICF